MVEPQVDAYTEKKARIAERFVKADELANKVGHLRLAGAPFREIARSLECSLGATHKAWRRFRKALVRAGVDEEREVLAGRLERQYLDLQGRLRAGEPQAHLAGVKILELMATVLGLEAPAQVQVQGGPVYNRFEFVVEPVPEQASVEQHGDAPDSPRLENDQQRQLGPAEVAATAEVES